MAVSQLRLAFVLSIHLLLTEIFFRLSYTSQLLLCYRSALLL